ncbi:hypothetical protein BDB01DRAFT_807059 [Pilobolus umbonatus]|nr:hypothetical protein BDB01DRAFT_807059 [Pilobolus umbonatus]
MNRTHIKVLEDSPVEFNFSYFPHNVQTYVQHAVLNIIFLSITLGFTVLIMYKVAVIVYRTRKWLPTAVLSQTLLSFIAISSSLVQPISYSSCDVRFWLTIVVVNLGGCVVQSILLYKAFICYNRSMVLIILGSVVNLGYIVLIIICATLGKVPAYKDMVGNCVMDNLGWPALAKLGVDVLSNLFLSILFLWAVYRYYSVSGNSLYRSLFKDGVVFSIGIILCNLLVAILISCQAMGRLSADLYCFECKITLYD